MYELQVNDFTKGTTCSLYPLIPGNRQVCESHGKYMALQERFGASCLDSPYSEKNIRQIQAVSKNIGPINNTRALSVVHW